MNCSDSAVLVNETHAHTDEFVLHDGFISGILIFAVVAPNRLNSYTFSLFVMNQFLYGSL